MPVDNLNWQSPQVCVDSVNGLRGINIHSFLGTGLKALAIFTFGCRCSGQSSNYIHDSCWGTASKRNQRFNLVLHAPLQILTSFVYLHISGHSSPRVFLDCLIPIHPLSLFQASPVCVPREPVLTSCVLFIPLNWHIVTCQTPPMYPVSLYFIDCTIPSKWGTDSCHKCPMYACKIQKLKSKNREGGG